jgi:hypothetical protein
MRGKPGSEALSGSVKRNAPFWRFFGFSCVEIPIT